IRRGRMHGSGSMSECKETCNPAPFGLVGIHRESFVSPAAGMRNMICAPPDRMLCGGIDDVEYEWSVNRNRRMQASRRLPCAIAHAADKAPMSGPGCLQRQTMSIACHRHAFLH